jgi:hypothetical protein
MVVTACISPATMVLVPPGVVTQTSVPPLACRAVGLAPAKSEISGLVAVGTDVWVTTPGGTSTIVAGEMHAVTTMGNYASTSAPVAGTMCLDASKYTGIKFKVHSPTNTSLLFVVVTPETSADSSNFRKQVTITAASTDVTVAFADLMKAPFGAGLALPTTYQPKTRLTAIGFGVGVMTEKLDLFLDDVTFY